MYCVLFIHCPTHNTVRQPYAAARRAERTATDRPTMGRFRAGRCGARAQSCSCWRPHRRSRRSGRRLASRNRAAFLARQHNVSRPKPHVEIQQRQRCRASITLQRALSACKCPGHVESKPRLRHQFSTDDETSHGVVTFESRVV